MSINVKTKKILWGKSGNRCVFCRTELIVESKNTTDVSVIGEECHIHSQKPNGPRYDINYPEDLVDTYENLILLCSIHHKIIDDHYDKYTSDVLKQMKSNHESWIAKQLSTEKEIPSVKIKRIKENIPSHLMKIVSGKQLTSLLDGCAFSEYSYDDTLSRQELTEISNFLQEIQDYADIYSELDISDKIASDIALNDLVEELDRSNIWVFAARENRIITGGICADNNFPVLILQILKKDNDSIIKMEFDK